MSLEDDCKAVEALFMDSAKMSMKKKSGLKTQCHTQIKSWRKWQNLQTSDLKIDELISCNVSLGGLCSIISRCRAPL